MRFSDSGVSQRSTILRRRLSFGLGVVKFLTPLLLLALPSVSSAMVAPNSTCDGRPVVAMNFTGGSLTSGVDLQPGAIYSYSAVTPGVDAEVRIVSFAGGATVGSVADGTPRPNNFDNDDGMPGALQPELQASENDFVTFEVSFFDAGTSTPVAFDFTATQIDVDGDNVTLREFVEFEDNFVEFVLNNPTVLAINASGPSQPGRQRFESSNSTVAPGIDPTAVGNLARAVYTNTSSFEYSLGTLGAGNSTRLTSLAFDCPSITNAVVTPGPGALTVEKSAPSNADNDATGSVTVGDVLTYTVTATNNGSVTLTGATVSDALLTPNSASCPTLASGGTCVLTGTHTVTEAEADSGMIINTGSATSTEVVGPIQDTVNTPVVLSVIAAVNDSATGVDGIAGANNVLSVLTGDTLNSASATTSNVVITVAPTSSLPAGLSFDTVTGFVSVDPGTPAGPLSFDYRICETLNPDNCTTATASVTIVLPPIDAIAETFSAINGATGGTTSSILDSDTLNSVMVDPADVTLTIDTLLGPDSNPTSAITVNPNGTVTVPAPVITR